MSESIDHITEVASLSDWSISKHLVHKHGWKDEWPFKPRHELLKAHGDLHLAGSTTHVISDKTQVSTDTIDTEVEDGQPRTEDEVTVMAEAQERTIADLERQVAELEQKLANEVRIRETRETMAANRVLEAYKDRVREQVNHYIERGDLCKEEAKNISDELDLDMTFGYKVTGTIEFTYVNVSEDIGSTYSIERRIEDLVRDALEGEFSGDDVECEEMSADVSCEEQD